VRRLVSVLGVVSILLGAAAAPVGAAAPDPSNQAGPPGRILGVVPVLEQGKAGRPSGGGNLIYHYTSGVGGIRVSTHYFNDESDIDTLLGAVRRLLKQRPAAARSSIDVSR